MLTNSMSIGELTMSGGLKNIRNGFHVLQTEKSEEKGEKKMKTFRCIAVAAMILVLISGCVATSDQQRTKGEGAVLGAVVGGLVGYLAGDTKGAVIGAAAGAGVGYLVGNEIAKRKANYATQEDFLNAEIDRTAEFNETTRAYNERNRIEVARLEQESASLRAAYNSGTEKKSVLQTKQVDVRKRLERNKELEKTLLTEMEIQMAILAKERETLPEDDPHIARLEHEVQELQRNIEILREGSTQLARIDERLSV
jgi:hypothetical protein